MRNLADIGVLRVLAISALCAVSACGMLDEKHRSEAVVELAGRGEWVSAPSSVQPYDMDSAKAALAKVTIVDGVSRDEAGVIGFYFFHNHSDVGCGAPDRIRESESSWVISTLFGYAAEPGDDITISKVDGSVVWRQKRCVADPVAMLRADFVSQCLE